MIVAYTEWNKSDFDETAAAVAAVLPNIGKNEKGVFPFSGLQNVLDKIPPAIIEQAPDFSIALAAARDKGDELSNVLARQLVQHMTSIIDKGEAFYKSQTGEGKSSKP